MTISFNQIPLNILTVGQFVEFDSSRAQQGLAVKTPRVLVIAPRLAAGTYLPANTLRRITGKESAAKDYGAGSIMAQMLSALFTATRTLEVWAYDVSDAGGGVAATGTLTLTGPATAAGTLVVYIAGRKVSVPVAAADTATAIATALVAAVNAIADIPATAANVAGVVTFTARNKGTPGNAIDLRVNYNREDRLPAGVTAVFVAMASGATDPDLTAAVAAMGGQSFDAVICAYTSSTGLGLLKTEIDSRWGPTRMSDGLLFGAVRDTFGNLSSFGAARNGQFESFVGYKGGPNPPWEWAAVHAAKIMEAAAADPARPFHTIILPGLLAPSPTERFTRAERELLLQDGISTWTVDSGGNVLIERPITTYQTDQNGDATYAWYDLNTPLVLSYMRYTLRVRIAQKYPRHKLGNDGTDYDQGQAIVTPSTLRAELIAWARDNERAGLMENVDQFKSELIVERDLSDPNRVNALVPPDLINQLRVFAAQIQYRL